MPATKKNCEGFIMTLNRSCRSRREEMEITSIFAGIGMLVFLIGGAISLSGLAISLEVSVCL